MGISISLYKKDVPSNEYVSDFYLGSATGIALTFPNSVMIHAPILDSLLEASYGEDISGITGSDIEKMLSEIKLIIPLIKNKNKMVTEAFERLITFLDSENLTTWELIIS
jgi:hypothetical protein